LKNFWLCKKSKNDIEDVIIRAAESWLFHPINMKTQNEIHRLMFRWLEELRTAGRITTYGWNSKDITVDKSMEWNLFVNSWRLRLTVNETGIRIDWLN
jgi:hypothetical protein